MTIFVRRKNTRLSRRLVVSGLGTLLATAGRARAERPASVVTLFGDSIAAGYGLPPGQGLAAVLEAELERLGRPSEVRNAGFPGATSADGRARVRSAVKSDTNVCVVEFGGNDRIRGFPPSLTRACLDAIVRELKDRSVSVVLMGLAVPDDPADLNATAFNAAFTDVAKTHELKLCPDFMGGITRDAGLRQPDGVHPNAAGALIIARKIAPLVVQTMNRSG